MYILAQLLALIYAFPCTVTFSKNKDVLCKSSIFLLFHFQRWNLPPTGTALDESEQSPHLATISKFDLNLQLAHIYSICGWWRCQHNQGFECPFTLVTTAGDLVPWKHVAIYMLGWIAGFRLHNTWTHPKDLHKLVCIYFECLLPPFALLDHFRTQLLLHSYFVWCCSIRVLSNHQDKAINIAWND